MRNIDLHSKYTDLSGKILQGCMEVMVFGGNTKAPIFDRDGTPIANPQLTDEMGRSDIQIFVDSDVTVYFYKYIGTGSFAEIEYDDVDTSDSSLWSLQYTADSIDDTLLNIASDTTISVENISALRALDPDTVPRIGDADRGPKTVTVLGYEKAGDTSPVQYIWDQYSDETDDGGSVIAGDRLTGRWILTVPGEVLDIRHFGVLPAESEGEASDESVQIVNAASYANRNGLKLWFPKVTVSEPNEIEKKHYKYSEVTVEIPNGIIFDDGIVMNDIYYNSSFTAYSIEGNPSFQNRLTDIVTHEAKTSWGARSIRADIVILDDQYGINQDIYSGCDVIITDDVSNWRAKFENCRVFITGSVSSDCEFDGCWISSPAKISGPVTFKKCWLDQNMFDGTPSGITIDDACTFDIQGFKSKKSMWLDFMGQQGASSYDWQGLPTTEKPWNTAVKSDMRAISWKGGTDPVELEEDTTEARTYYFENCSGAIEIQGAANNLYIFKNSEMTLTFKDGCSTGITLRADGSALNISQSRIRVEALNMTDSSLAGSGSIDAREAYIHGSTVSSGLHCGNLDADSSTFTSNIQIYGHLADSPITFEENDQTYIATVIISGNVKGCTFAGEGRLVIGTENGNDEHYSDNQLVRGLSIINCLGLSEDPIAVYECSTSRFDNQNQYTYQGNRGTMEMKTHVEGNIPRQTPDVGYIINGAATVLYAYTSPALQYDYVFDCKLFTIGSVNVKVDVATYPLYKRFGGLYLYAGANNRLTSDVNMMKVPGVQLKWHIRSIIVAVGTIALYDDGDPIEFDLVQM